MEERDVQSFKILYLRYIFSGRPQALSSPLQSQSLSETQPTFLKNHRDTGTDGPTLENYVDYVTVAVSSVPKSKITDCSLHDRSSRVCAS